MFKTILQASKTIQAVTPEPQLKISGVFPTLLLKNISVNSFLVFNFPLLRTLSKGMFIALGMCPLLSPFLGSGSSELNRLTERASINK